jgi:hypothetical protein
MAVLVHSVVVEFFSILKKKYKEMFWQRDRKCFKKRVGPARLGSVE